MIENKTVWLAGIVFIISGFLMALENKREMFDYYPALKVNLHHVSLGNFPTPVSKLEALGNYLGHHDLYFKNDGLSGKDGLYGGNKVRKLEFIFGDALHSGAKEVITCGGTGSNHALATACYSKQLGLKCTAILDPQPSSKILRNNLLMGSYYGVNFHPCDSLDAFEEIASMIVIEREKETGIAPYIIPLGGSLALGTVGFVNAVFELKVQIENGEIPKPDIIYLPIGSAGTTAGILLGLKAAGLDCKVVAVRVGFERMLREELIKEKFDGANKLLHSLDSTFPLFEFNKDNLYVERGFWGGEYGLFTTECVEAIRLMKEHEEINLDGSYSGKSLSALINDIRQEKLDGKKVLFWGTYCGEDFTSITKNLDYKKLPEKFHRYFEEDVQFLDR